MVRPSRKEWPESASTDGGQGKGESREHQLVTLEWQGTLEPKGRGLSKRR